MGAKSGKVKKIPSFTYSTLKSLQLLMSGIECSLFDFKSLRKNKKKEQRESLKFFFITEMESGGIL